MQLIHIFSCCQLDNVTVIITIIIIDVVNLLFSMNTMGIKTLAL